MNLDRSLVAVFAALLAASSLMGCSKEEGSDADSSEGAASVGQAACGDGFQDVKPEVAEFRLAPLNAQTCVTASSKSTDKARALNKCLVYSSHAYFKPVAGHVAVACMLEKGGTTNLTPTEIAACADKGLKSICAGARLPESQTFCSDVVTALKASGVKDDGNAALQRCNWIAPGLATRGLAEMKKCLASPDAAKSGRENLDGCLDRLGTPAASK